jgi:hypothetical protein
MDYRFWWVRIRVFKASDLERKEWQSGSTVLEIETMEGMLLLI